MKKVWYTIKIKCTKESVSINSKLGEVTVIGKIKGEGNAYATVVAMQQLYKNHYKVYYC